MFIFFFSQILIDFEIKIIRFTTKFVEWILYIVQSNQSLRGLFKAKNSQKWSNTDENDQNSFFRPEGAFKWKSWRKQSSFRIKFYTWYDEINLLKIQVWPKMTENGQKRSKIEQIEQKFIFRPQKVLKSKNWKKTNQV